MAGSVNKVILIGNLGKDPEIRRTQDGRPIANLSVATSENWRDKATGERRERTEWHRVVIFNEGLCRIAEQYLKKGAKVYLEGQLQTRKWQDKDGQDKYSTEVVLQGFNSQLTMLDRAGGGGGAGDYEEGASGSEFGASGPARRPAAVGAGGKRGDMDDEISVLICRYDVRSVGAAAEERRVLMRMGFIAAALLAAGVAFPSLSAQAAPNRRVSVTGCVFAGTTANCLMIRAPDGTIYDISSVGARPRLLDRMIRVRATISNKPSICNQGIVLERIRWSRTRLRCSSN